MRDHGSDDLMVRGARAMLGARPAWSPDDVAAVRAELLRPDAIIPLRDEASRDADLARLRALSASDAALARAIDAVPGRTHAGRDLRPFMTLEPTG